MKFEKTNGADTITHQLGDVVISEGSHYLVVKTESGRFSFLILDGSEAFVEGRCTSYDSLEEMARRNNGDVIYRNPTLVLAKSLD